MAKPRQCDDRDAAACRRLSSVGQMARAASVPLGPLRGALIQNVFVDACRVSRSLWSLDAAKMVSCRPCVSSGAEPRPHAHSAGRSDESLPQAAGAEPAWRHYFVAKTQTASVRA